MSIGVLVVDDEELVRMGLRLLIDATDDIRVVGEAADGDEVVAAVRSSAPDVVLLDVRMPVMDGIRAMAELTRAFDPPPRVLMLTTFGNDEYVHAALRAGASGLLLKRAPATEITHAIRLAAGGSSLVVPATSRPAEHPGSGEARQRVRTLSDREREVLRAMAEGLSNVEIAARLVVSRETVKTHVSSVLTKLRARDRTQAVITAYEAGLVGRRFP